MSTSAGQTKKESRFARNFPYLILAALPVPLLIMWMWDKTSFLDQPKELLIMDAYVVFAAIAMIYAMIRKYLRD